MIVNPKDYFVASNELVVIALVVCWAITAAIAATGAEGPKDMGKVIARLKADYPGRIDFGKASGLVRAALSA